jgi:hypothetical protein
VAILDVPGTTLLDTNSTSVVEEKEGIQLTCIVQEDQHGNPMIYSYYWKYPAVSDWINSTQSSQTISSNTISAILHDGQWQCMVGNLVGNGTVSQVDITVNGSFQ